ncbi:MAG: hypothetical protein HYY76_05425 [Acidobacteria bacterium]|nr:hypothetical protein [Acidobacteriota bacterium]
MAEGGLRDNDPPREFVFISGDILNPQVHWLTDSSQVPLLSKPFDMATLDKVLDQVIARRFGNRHVAAVQRTT